MPQAFWDGFSYSAGMLMPLVFLVLVALCGYGYVKYRIRRRAQQIAAVPGVLVRGTAQVAQSGISAAGSVAKTGAGKSWDALRGIASKLRPKQQVKPVDPPVDG